MEKIGMQSKAAASTAGVPLHKNRRLSHMDYSLTPLSLRPACLSATPSSPTLPVPNPPETAFSRSYPPSSPGPPKMNQRPGASPRLISTGSVRLPSILNRAQGVNAEGVGMAAHSPRRCRPASGKGGYEYEGKWKLCAMEHGCSLPVTLAPSERVCSHFAEVMMRGDGPPWCGASPQHSTTEQLAPFYRGHASQLAGGGRKRAARRGWAARTPTCTRWACRQASENSARDVCV